MLGRLLAVLRDDGQVDVARREEHGLPAELSGERDQAIDEHGPSLPKPGQSNLVRVPRSRPRLLEVVVDADDGDAEAREGTHRGEAILPEAEDDGGRGGGSVDDRHRIERTARPRRWPPAAGCR